MQNDDKVEKRRPEYARNETLESLLGELNSDLAIAEELAIRPFRGQLTEKPPVFIVGPPRCGSTLFMQWLAATGAFGYPSNLLSRFWAAPITGIRIQKLLSDPEYDFRNELHDLKSNIGFTSDHGKTAGALSPNEFWYFWRRFFQGDDYQPRSELEQHLDAETLQAELAGITHLFGKPFAAKGFIFNENIPLMADLFPNAIFVWIKRRPEFNVQSLLETRQRQFGDMGIWYSFRIKDYPWLRELPPLESVCGQVASIHRAIESGLSGLSPDRRVEVMLDDFCRAPEAVYEIIRERLRCQKADLPAYDGAAYFNNPDNWRLGWVTQASTRACYEQVATGL